MSKCLASVLGAIQKVRTLNFIEFLTPSPLMRFYKFLRYPIPLRVRILNFSTPLKHLSILFISVIAKFATFDTYLKRAILRVESRKINGSTAEEGVRKAQ